MHSLKHIPSMRASKVELSRKLSRKMPRYYLGSFHFFPAPIFIYNGFDSIPYATQNTTQGLQHHCQIFVLLRYFNYDY